MLELVTPTLELVTPSEKCLSVWNWLLLLWNWLPLLKNAQVFGSGYPYFETPCLVFVSSCFAFETSFFVLETFWPDKGVQLQEAANAVFMDLDMNNHYLLFCLCQSIHVNVLLHVVQSQTKIEPWIFLFTSSSFW